MYAMTFSKVLSKKAFKVNKKAKKERKTKTNENIFSWSQFSINELKSKYPAAPFVTTALFLIALQSGILD